MLSKLLLNVPTLSLIIHNLFIFKTSDMQIIRFVFIRIFSCLKFMKIKTIFTIRRTKCYYYFGRENYVSKLSQFCAFNEIIA